MKKLVNVPVQLKELEIINFKNVKKGKITFIKKDKKQDYENVMALYGQNGSGKTTFVNVLDLLKSYISYEPLNFPINKLEDFYDYFSVNEKTSKLKAIFLVNIAKKLYQVEYMLEFIKSNADKSYVIKKEKLSYKNNQNETYIEYNKGYKFSEDVSANFNNISTSLNAAEKLSIQNKQSFIFNSYLIQDYCKINNLDIFGKIMNNLQIFSRFNMFVITNKLFGMINLQWSLPFMFRLSKNKGTLNDNNEFIGQEEITSGGQNIDLKKPQIVTLKFYEDLNKMFHIINEILTRIIPDTKIDIIANKCILQNGQTGMAIELVTIRNGMTVPMRNESTGILKLISIIQTLITYCTFDDIFLAIDEFDAGIFEHLLGKLLDMLSKEGKGQLFFTSHNLRPLEVLDKNCLYFSTINPENRYIKLTNIKTNNNVRDFYLRALELGGQKEEIYKDDDMSAISILLRRLEKNE